MSFSTGGAVGMNSGIHMWLVQIKGHFMTVDVIGMLQGCHGVLNETYFYQLDFSTKQVVQTLR